MMEIRRTDSFTDWLRGLSDRVALAKIAARIDRLASGNSGDVAPVGQGVSELRIHHGPGYRVYFRQMGPSTYVLLCGGDKGTQVRDIERAKALSAEL